MLGRATMAEQIDYLERLRAISGPQPHRFTEQTSGTSAPATPENAHTRAHCGSKDNLSPVDSSAFPLTSFDWTPDLSELDRPPVVGALSE